MEGGAFLNYSHRVPFRKRRRRRPGSNLATPRLPRGDFYGYRLFRRYSPIGRPWTRPMHGTFRNYASYGFLMSLWLSFFPDRYRETGREIAAPWGPTWYGELIYERRRGYWGLDVGRFRMKRPFCGVRFVLFVVKCRDVFLFNRVICVLLSVLRI